MMAVWFRDYNLAEINRLSQGTMLEHLEIEFTEIGADSLTARMPVDHRTHQPAGVLHGGASAALAESLGSVAANLCVDPNRKYCVGMELNINHLRPVKKGWVIGTTTPLHLGRMTQVWEIKIYTEDRKLVAVSRITLAVLDKQ